MIFFRVHPVSLGAMHRYLHGQCLEFFAYGQRAGTNVLETLVGICGNIPLPQIGPPTK